MIENTNGVRMSRSSQWVQQYKGKNIVRGYCNWYGVDALSAVIELRPLGVSISAEREDELRKSAVRRTAKRQKCDHQKKIEKPGVS